MICECNTYLASLSVARFVQKYDLLTMKNLHLRILRNSGKVLHLAGSSRIRLGGGGFLIFEGS